MTEPDAAISIPDSCFIADVDITERLHPQELFDRQQPLHVDVGCGKGRFLLARAAACPDVNFIGIDRLLVRLRKIDRKARRAALANVRLLRLEAAYSLAYLFPPESVSVFYIFFPDPWPKRRHHRRRLFDTSFVDSLQSRLVDGGRIHAATDHLDYFADIHALLTAHTALREMQAFEPKDEEKTDFELEFLKKGKPIGRCSFENLPAPGPADRR